MYKILEKIAAHSFDHPWRIIMILLIATTVLAFGAKMNMQTPTSAVSIPNTEAYTGIQRKSALFPETGKGSARIVLTAPTGKTLDSYQQQIVGMSNNIAAVPGVKQSINPFENPSAMSKDGKTAFIQIQLTEGSGSIDAKTIDDINNIVSQNRVGGLSLEQDGDIVDNEPHSILGPGESISLVVALAVLLITFVSLAAAGMPLLTAVLAVGISMAGLFSLSKVVEINSVTPSLAVMLGLAVGIDYSLFIINRYRGYLLDGLTEREATIRAVRTAGSAVVFAATTVFIALAALSVVRIPFMTVMGLAGAATVALAAIIAITFLPALFRLAGPKILNKHSLRKAEAAQSVGYKPGIEMNKRHIWHRWAMLVSRHPVIFILLTVIVIGLVALPIKSLKLGLPTAQYAAKTTSQRKAYDSITKAFGVGYNAPLIVVVEGLQPVSAAEKQAAMATLTEHYGHTQPPAAAQAKTTEYVKRINLQAISNQIAQEKNVQKVIPAQITNDGTSGVLQVIPESAPYDEATKTLINTLRNPAKQAAWGGGKVRFLVTGSTALQIDTNAKLASAIPIYLLVVVGLSLILLVVAFRSILVPIKATLGYLLSVAAMLGALVAVFQWGWFGIASAPAPIVSFIPIIGTGILFGLAMDYEFFLVSSMKEEYDRTGQAKQSVVNGFVLGGKVVTAAAVIMVSVFAGFIGNDNSTVQALGFALATGILVDAFLIRMTLVPAIMTLTGKHAWWIPHWLGKLLPKTVLSETSNNK